MCDTQPVQAKESKWSALSSVIGYQTLLHVIEMTRHNITIVFNNMWLEKVRTIIGCACVRIVCKNTLDNFCTAFLLYVQ